MQKKYFTFQNIDFWRFTCPHIYVWYLSANKSYGIFSNLLQLLQWSKLVMTITQSFLCEEVHMYTWICGKYANLCF